jgi:hypothetical protein
MVLLLLPLCESRFHSVREIYNVHLNILRKDKEDLLMIYSLEYPVLFFKELKLISITIIRIKNHKIPVLNLQKFLIIKPKRCTNVSNLFLE